MKLLHWTRRLAVLLALVLLSTHSAAQTGAIRIVYVFGPGGTGDVAARLIAEHMRKSLGVPVVVENKAGAGGRIAIDAVKAAAPDGNTLLLTSLGPMAILPHTESNLRYDPFKDFEPVIDVAESPLVLAVSSKVQARNIAEYVAQVKKDPAAGFFAVVPLGGLPHFLGLHFAALNGIKLSAVGYKGSSQMTQALMAGEVPATYYTPTDLVPLYKAGKVRILAVSSTKRMSILPEVPTFKEEGFNVDATTWYGMFAPAGTPSATVARLSQAITAAINDPAIRTRLIEMGLEPTGRGPAELARALRDDYNRWGPVIKASGYKVGE